jgi:hypothetical protein
MIWVLVYHWSPGLSQSRCLSLCHPVNHPAALWDLEGEQTQVLDRQCFSEEHISLHQQSPKSEWGSWAKTAWPPVAGLTGILKTASFYRGQQSASMWVGGSQRLSVQSFDKGLTGGKGLTPWGLLRMWSLADSIWHNHLLNEFLPFAVQDTWGRVGLEMLNQFWSWTLVAHSYDPSYSGGRDQEDHSSKPVQANSSRDLM